jgi:NAD(P)H-dependent FMN reductase
MIIVISTSLNLHSRSRILAETARDELQRQGAEAELLDISKLQLPFCNAGNCYAHPDVQHCASRIKAADAILLATPIYNYDVNAAAKNLIELTGRSWQGKVVGFLASAGGQGSYMSLVGLGNSLMLDFRCVMIPRFVFATEKAVVDNQLVDPEIARRIRQLAQQTIWMGTALSSPPADIE